MCEYCGCQDLPAIAQLTAEHDRLRDLGRSLVDAAASADLDRARTVAQSMLDVLDVHTSVEEDALFPAMAGEYERALRHLADEHVTVHSTLTALAVGAPGPDWRAHAQAVVHLLFEHILKEQDGVFPAALSVLTPADWELLDTVREQRTPSRLDPREPK